VPAGTHIDGSNPKWLGTTLPTPMPINAQALDDQAALMMLRRRDQRDQDKSGGWQVREALSAAGQSICPIR